MPYVQFADDMRLEVICSFGGPQDHLPNVAKIPTWDVRWRVFFDKMPIGMSPGHEPTERWEDPES
jgi:hypothetical protein